MCFAFDRFVVLLLADKLLLLLFEQLNRLLYFPHIDLERDIIAETGDKAHADIH